MKIVITNLSQATSSHDIATLVLKAVPLHHRINLPRHPKARIFGIDIFAYEGHQSSLMYYAVVDIWPDACARKVVHRLSGKKMNGIMPSPRLMVQRTVNAPFNIPASLERRRKV